MRPPMVILELTPAELGYIAACVEEDYSGDRSTQMCLVVRNKLEKALKPPTIECAAPTTHKAE